jgi:hypothetical protein
MDGFSLITAAGTRWTDGCGVTPTLTLFVDFWVIVCVVWRSDVARNHV